MNAADRLWVRAVRAGARLGCHQRPERSFFLLGRQMPVCARCTGVILGQAAVFLLGRLARRVTPVKGLCFLLIILADHTAQTLGRESTNARRLVTGFLAGAAVGNLYKKVIIKIVKIAKRCNDAKLT